MARLAAAPLVIGLTAGYIGRCRELEATSAAATQRPAISTHCHGLTSPMTAGSDIASALKTEALGRLSGTRGRFVRSRGILRCIPTRSGCGELEARCGSLLLRKLGSLLRFRQSKRMAALMTAARRATSTTAVASILTPLVALLLLVEVRIP